MYGVVMLALISAGEQAPAHHHYFPYKAYPHSAGNCYGACYGVGYTGFNGFGFGEDCVHPGNPGGWGKPYGGYGPVHGIPGYDCYGGCGGYHSPAYGVPTPPVIAPNPYQFTPSGVAPPPADEGKKDKDPSKKSMDDDDDGISMKTRARLLIDIPEGAKLFVDDSPIANPERGSFRTPELQKGKRYFYDVRVEAVIDGQKVTETKRVPVLAGDTVRTDFTRMKPATEVATSEK